MGSSNMNGWLSGWTKKRYKEVCKDLCTCFIKRGFSLSDDRGYEALITSDTCMYISSFEKMRKEVIERTSIVCFIDTRGTNAHPDVFDANAGWVLWNHPGANIKGSYFKLNHPIPEKGQGLLEALANPDCGWFYRADASSFEAISGNPIAYWASKKTLNSFALPSLKQKMETRVGMATADNDRFLRCWWEVPLSEFSAIESSRSSAAESKAKWFPYTKGGEYRKWYGNREFVVNWENDGDQIRNNIDPKTGRVKSHNYNDDYAFKPNISWSYLSSSSIHVRVTPAGSLFDSTAGTGFCDKWEDLLYCSSLINSSTADYYLTFLAPTMAYKQGEVEKIPDRNLHVAEIAKIANECYQLTKMDWDTDETSWEFMGPPIL